MDPVNGYRTVKTAMGRKFRVKMEEEEIRERSILQAMVVLAPAVMVVLFAWAAGMI